MLELNNLNEAQRRAVTWGRGPLLLLAGPGSGKTFTVTNRILYLLERGVPPEEILAITFTKEAAVALQRRFQQMSDTLQPVGFGTFHSVFYHILKESRGFRHLKLFNDSQKKKLMISILKRYKEQKGEVCQWEELSEDAVRILAAVSLYKNTADRERAAAGMPPGWREYFEEIFGFYNSETKRERVLDFDDMLFECRRLLEEDSRVRSSWQRRFRHILIDEFQDCNPMQYEAVRLLAAAPYNLFVVGDDDQSIYGFRGAEPDILRRFTEDFQAERLLLDVNYRCTEEIVKASLSVIGENRNRFSKALRAAHGSAEAEEKSGLCIRSFRDRAEQSACLLAQADKWRREHREDGGQCAILFRTNSYMQRAAAALHRAGIPFFMRETGRSVYEHFVAKDIMAYLLLAAGDWRREYLLRIINRPVRYISREAVGEGRRIQEMKAYYEGAAGRGREVQERLSCLQRQLESLRRMPPALGVQYVLRAVNYDDYLRTLARGKPERLSEWREIAEWLRADAGQYKSVQEWAEAQASCVAEAGRGTAGQAEGEALWLMTVHGAKGLEFDKVIIPDCNERVFPYGELQDKETVEEERRIFYVAMTRAKKSLELLYLTGDSARPRLPSRFLNPLIKRNGKAGN